MTLSIKSIINYFNIGDGKSILSGFMSIKLPYSQEQPLLHPQMFIIDTLKRLCGRIRER
jgi:hypothetical protein